MYKKVELPKEGYVGMEKEVAELWKEKDIVKKNFNKNEGKKYFMFYDGPPTANGMPHVGHIETRVMKDIIPRYKVMKGYYVPRKAGWDTHGLPVELEIEKKLGISGKEQIEDYGVEKFVKECKDSVFQYVHIWEKMTNQVGYWVDMEHPYVTYHNDYIESVWWALKELWKKGLLYEGHKVMPYCPRCGTALSSHEVAQGYKDVKDLTCIAKFKVKGKENTYILAWTTTPWTLPSNLALCVNKSYIYAEVKVNAEVTINYVITDEERKIKMVCVDPHDIPIIAIVDTELMASMPKGLAAETGLDALTHAVEGYITKAHNLMSDMFHMKAIKLIFENLSKAVNDKDPEAIEKMGYAQYIAGMGFSNVGLGIVHSMAHQLGAVYDTPHGIANAMLLPTVMRFNGENPETAQRFREILCEIGRPDAAHLNDQDVINTFVWMISELSRSVGVTQKITDYGAKAEDFEMLAEKAMQDPCKPGNPREVSKEEFVELFRRAAE